MRHQVQALESDIATYYLRDLRQGLSLLISEMEEYELSSVTVRITYKCEYTE